MSNEKRLVSLFKNFMERTCVALIKTQAKLLKQWLYFSTLLSQQSIDYQRIEKYVDSLNTAPKQEIVKPPAMNQQLFPDYDGFLKKKLEIVEKYKQQQSPNFYLNKTYGGERSPLKMLSTTVPDQTNRNAGEVKRKSFHDRGLTKRLNNLYQQFVENDKKLSTPSQQQFRLTESIRQISLI